MIQYRLKKMTKKRYNASLEISPTLLELRSVYLGICLYHNVISDQVTVTRNLWKFFWHATRHTCRVQGWFNETTFGSFWNIYKYCHFTIFTMYLFENRNILKLHESIKFHKSRTIFSPGPQIRKMVAKYNFLLKSAHNNCSINRRFCVYFRDL